MHELWRYIYTCVHIALCFLALGPSVVFALAPHPLMLTDAAAAAVFTVAPPPLMLADLRAAAVNASSSLPMVLADAAATAVFTSTSLPLVLERRLSLGAGNVCLVKGTGVPFRRKRG